MMNHKHTFGAQSNIKHQDYSPLASYLWGDAELENTCLTITKRYGGRGPAAGHRAESWALIDAVTNAVNSGLLELTDSNKEIIKKYLTYPDTETLETL